MRVLLFSTLAGLFCLVSCVTAPSEGGNTATGATPQPAGAAASPGAASGPNANANTTSNAAPSAKPGPDGKQQGPKAAGSASAAAASTPAAVPRVLKAFHSETRTSYPDGYLSGVTKFSYDDHGRLSAVSEWNASEIMINQRSYEYKPDGGIEIKLFDGDRKLKSKTIQVYQAGRLVQEKVLNERDEIQSVSDFTYNAAGQKTSWVLQGKASATTASEYSWTGDKLTQITVLDSARNAIKKYQRSYDDKGKLIREDEYDSKAQLVKRTASTWNGELLAREESRSAQDAVLKASNYHYDAEGRLVRIELYNRKGELIEVQAWHWAELSVIPPAQ